MTEAEKTLRVLITCSPLAEEAMAMLEKRTSWYITPQYPNPGQIAELAAKEKIDAMIVRQGLINREVLSASPNLRIVVKHGVGVDNIDICAATELKIPVCITANANYQSVAEHALAMMFALSKNLFLNDRQMRNGVWVKIADPGTEIFKKCLGIVGVGRIGRRLAELVQPFNMDILGYDPLLPEERFPAIIRRVANLEELLRNADFISLHCPKTPETTNLIGKRELEIMKPTAILVNTARGGIVDESALVCALQEGQLKGAGIDCFTTEPLPANHPLTTIQDRLIITPHSGGVTQETLVRMGTEAVNIIFKFFNDSEIASKALLNQEAITHRK